VNADLARRTELSDRVRTLRADRSSPALPEREAHYRKLSWGIMPFILEMSDRTAAASGVVPRYPFWDRRLIEFCLALPPEQKIKRGLTRLVMRRGLAGVLPETIRCRGGKANFSTSFRAELLAHERELLERVILKDSDVIAEYVDMSALRSAYERYLGQNSNEDALNVFTAVTLALWLQRASSACVI